MAGTYGLKIWRSYQLLSIGRRMDPVCGAWAVPLWS